MCRKQYLKFPSISKIQEREKGASEQSRQLKLVQLNELRLLTEPHVGLL